MIARLPKPYASHSSSELLVLLQRGPAVERFGPDVADHGRVAHEAREALEVAVVPRLEPQPGGLDDASRVDLRRAGGHSESIGVWGAKLYVGQRY